MKFIQQSVKLPVINADTENNDNKPPRHGTLFPNSIRAIIAGPSGCGKTNVLFSLLVAENGVKFKNIYIYSKTLDQPKYQMLKDIIESIPGMQIFMFHENDTVISPEDALPNSVFIFDDVITESQEIIRTYFTRGRHNNIDIFYLTQSFSCVGKQLIRDNANMLILFKQDETNIRHIYFNNCSGDMTLNQFREFCHSCWNDSKFSFVVISKDHPRNEGRYRKCFDTFAII